MKKAVYIVTVIILVLIINGLLHSIYDLWHKQDLLTSAQKELEAEKLKNQKLKGEFTKAQSPNFIEETAHNKLFLVKPGEQQVLISQNLIENTVAEKIKQNISNCEKWLNVFF